VDDGVHDVTAHVPKNATAQTLDLRGFDEANCLVAARKVQLP
jgi:hypothetical protein